MVSGCPNAASDYVLGPNPQLHVVKAGSDVDSGPGPHTTYHGAPNEVDDLQLQNEPNVVSLLSET